MTAVRNHHNEACNRGDGSAERAQAARCPTPVRGLRLGVKPGELGEVVRGMGCMRTKTRRPTAGWPDGNPARRLKAWPHQIHVSEWSGNVQLQWQTARLLEATLAIATDGGRWGRGWCGPRSSFLLRFAGGRGGWFC